MRTWTLALVLGAAALPACREDPPPPAPAASKKPVKKASPEAWKEIATPVPVGKKLACASLLPVDKLGAGLARKVELVDDSARDSEATSVCRIMNVDKKGKVGDEVCMVSVYCWATFDVAEMTRRCDARGEQPRTDDVGLITCVQRVPAGDHERHVVTTLEPDTRCKIVVNAAPNQYELEQTKACARAVVDTIDQDSLKP